MTSHRDAEISATPDERAPLLAGETAHGEEGSSDVSSEPQKDASKTWQYVWRGFWVVLAILVIAVFVKGWISADDVDVSLAIPGCARSGVDQAIAVQFERRVKTSSGRRSEWSCRDGAPSSPLDAHTHNHELPVPPRNISIRCDKDALPRRWTGTVLSRHGCCAVPR
jgi:hypothetical protein